MSVPIIDPTLNPAMNNNTLNNSLATLQGLNAARKGFLDNQALQQTVPLAGQIAQAGLDQTKAQTGLIGAQTKAVPYTSVGTLLSGIGRAIPALSPFSYLRNAPDQVKDVASANQITGKQHIGNVPIPNYSALLGGIGGLIGHVLGGQGMSAPPTQALGGSTQPLGGQGMGAPPTQPSGAMVTLPQPLPLSAQQIQRTRQLFGSPQTSQPGVDEQARKLAADLDQAAKNKVASPALIQKYNYATNLAQTISTTERNFGIPAITFAPYMGVAGQAKLGKDLLTLSTKNKNPLAEKYVAFERSVHLLSGQLTQFYSGSIAHPAQEQLDTLQNPVTWKNSPGAAFQAYNNLKEIISTEGRTAAETVGKQEDFAKIAPHFNVQQIHSQLTKNLKYAPDVVRALTSSQQQQLRAYNESLKRVRAQNESLKRGSNG